MSDLAQGSTRCLTDRLLKQVEGGSHTGGWVGVKTFVMVVGSPPLPDQEAGDAPSDAPTGP